MNAKRMNAILTPRSPASWTLMAAALFIAPSAVARPCGINVESGQLKTVCSNQEHKCINVDANGILDICGATTLTLTGPHSSTVDGEVNLLGSGSRLAFTTRDHTVSGSGTIDGQNDGAAIVIDGVTLTSEMNIAGAMVITDGAGAGTFLNDGAVIANASGGTLDLQVTTIDDTAGSCRWKVKSSSTARLLFTEEPAALAGDFCVENGILQAGIDPGGAENINVDTTGCLSHGPAGEIRVLLDDSFVFCSGVR